MSPRAWLGLLLAAFLVRAVLVVIYRGGGSDIRIYYYFAQLLLAGANPYQAPLDGPIAPTYADMPPLNLGLFAGLLQIHDSRTTLRFFFGLVDLLILLTLGTWLRRPVDQRRWLVWFYAFCPLVLLAWVAIAQDKPVVFALFLGVVVALQSRRAWPAILLAALLAAYKGLGILLILPLATHFAAHKQQWATYFGIFGLLVILAHLPFFPDSLVVYEHRALRAMTDPPIHASAMMLLSKLGLYHSLLPKLLAGGSLIGVYALFFRRRLPILDTLVWAVFVANIFSPEIAITRLLLITLPFLLVIRLSRRRIVMTWVAATLAAVALLSTLGLPFGLASIKPVALFAETVFGAYGSWRHVLWMNLLPLLLVSCYLADRRHGWRKAYA